MAEFVVRRKPAGDKAAGWVEQASAGELSAYFPALSEWMTLVSLDGEPRQTSTLLLFTEGGKWKCRFLDREANCQAFVSADSPAVLLDALEAGLRADTLDWRACTVYAKTKGR